MQICTENIVGQEFNRLTVIKRDGQIYGKQAAWLCRCVCGNDSRISGHNLKTGKIKSCGCLSKELSRARVVLPEGHGARNKIIFNYKWSATKRNYTFSLTDDECIILLSANCVYCDSPPSSTYQQKQGNGLFTYNGIDRINNARGYEADNVVTCCKTCNRAKNDMLYDEFMAWIQRLVKFRG